MVFIKYKSIASHIRKKIISGDWYYDMKIPSQRDLANEFRVNRVTIIKSLELLESEGFIYTKVGSGTYVNDYLDTKFILNKWNEMMDWSLRSRSEYTVQLINKLETDSSFIHLSKGELGNDLIPHIELKNALTNISHYIGNLSFGYNNGYGYMKLRELIAARLNNEGFDVTYHNVLITSGALHAIQLLVTGFLSQNTVIFSNTPSYINSTKVFNYLNNKNIRFNYKNIKDLKKQLDKYSHYKDKAIYIETRLNNPTGDSLSLLDVEEVVNYTQNRNIPVIEDDIYRDVWFEGPPLPPMKSIANHGNIIHVSSFSKSIAPALRIGWIIASEKVIEQLADIRMQIDYGSSILSQMVIYEMLKDGDYDRHISRLKVLLQEKRDFMLNILNIHYKDIARWNIPKGSFFIWLTLKKDIKIKKIFSELIDKEKILINPGFIYGSKKNTIRLSYAFESKKNISYALLKLRDYL